MKKTKHFNISVPELGDVPDITQVSNAISDLEDATAGTLEIMKAEMQGTKITLTSVSRKTKRTGYYEGMSIRFKSPQDIEPNYLKTISVDGLGDQTLSVEYKVNRNEYIDIVYEGNKFTAYPVVVQKTDSVSNNSSVLVGTAKGVKTAYDKGVEALNKANQAQSAADSAQTTADGKVSKSGDTMTGTLRFDKFPDAKDAIKITSLDNSYSIFSGGIAGSGLNIYNYQTKNRIFLGNDGSLKLDGNNLNTSSKEVVSAINELNSGKEDKIEKKSGFNLDKSDSVTNNSSNTIATSLAVKTAYDKASQAQSTADGKVSKSGDTMTGNIHNDNSDDVEGVMEFTRYPTLRPKQYVGAIQANWYDNVAKFGIMRGGSDDLNTSSLKFTLNSQVYDIYHTGYLDSKLTTSSKTVSGAINELKSSYVQDIRLGALVSAEIYNGPGMLDKNGYVITGVTNYNADQFPDNITGRPIQKKINGVWYTISSVS